METICVAIVTICCIWYLKAKNEPAPLDDAIVFFCTGGSYVLYLGTLFRLRFEFIARIFILPVYHRAEKTYLCGSSVADYMQSEAFARLQQWLGNFDADGGGGICFELAALGMIVLRDNRTTVLRHVSTITSSGLPSPHAFVEYRGPLGIKMVYDMSWLRYPCVTPKALYTKHLKNYHEQWSCKHDEFWNLPMSQGLDKKLHTKKTSYMLRYLTAYGPVDKEYGFQPGVQHDYCADWHGEFEMPFYLRNEHLVTGAILRDFAKKESRLVPKRKHLRVAKLVRKKYERFLAEKHEEAETEPQEAPAKVS